MASIPDTPKRQIEQYEKVDVNELTTQQIWREVSLTKELYNTRFDAMDKAIGLLQSFADRSPTIAVVDEKLTGLHSKIETLLKGVQTQFTERDARDDQKGKDSSKAIDAALQAAKELVAEKNNSNSEMIKKMESGFTKEIDATKLLITVNDNSTSDKIAALDKRLTEMNGHARGLADGWGLLVGFIGLLVGGGGLIAFFSK
jgi:hypothetical protein